MHRTGNGASRKTDDLLRQIIRAVDPGMGPPSLRLDRLPDSGC